MGHSKSVKDEIDQNNKVSEWIKTATANLNSQADGFVTQFESDIATFYSDPKERESLGGGRNFDFRQTSEFNLDEISATIESFAAAVFFGGTPPDGTDVGDAKAVVKAAAGLLSDEVLAVYAAKAFLKQILGAFDTKISLQTAVASSSVLLRPGLMLHAMHYGTTFQNKDYFNNSVIVGMVVEFKLIYSARQAANAIRRDEMQKHADTISDLSQRIETMQSEVNSWMDDPAKSMEEIENWRKRVRLLRDDLDGYNAEVRKLLEGL